MILDQWGEPIDPSVLARMRDEISAPDPTDGRTPFPGHLAARMRPQALAAILRAADNGSSYEWRVLEEEIEELFPHYYAVLAKRRRQVCQLPVTVHPGGEGEEFRKHADFLTAWLDEGVLAESLFNMTDAIGKGRAILEIIWRTTPHEVVPEKLAYRSPRFFEISYIDGETPWLYTASGFETLAPHKFVVHDHPSKSGLTIRSGLTRAVAFLWMYSVFTLRDWAIFTQAYGLPVRLGRYGPEASAADRGVLWKAVSQIAGDTAAILPKSMEIEFVADREKRAGAELYERRLDWLNREVSKLVLGSTAATEALAGGHAVGKEHRDVEIDVKRYDAQTLATTINRQIIAPMIAFSFGPQTRYPRLFIGQPDQVPLQEFYPGVAAMIDRGLTVRAREVRERFGLSEPAAGEQTLGPRTDIGAGQKPLRAPPEEEGDMQSAFAPLRRVLMAAESGAGEVMEALGVRLAEEAEGALAGLSSRVRRAFDRARDLPDLAARLEALALPKAEFAVAMAKGLALAHLAGRAEVLEELGRLAPRA